MMVVGNGARSQWDRAETVQGFSQSPPNETLIRFAEAERLRHPHIGRALDIGCGAARNAASLARLGWSVLGIDASAAMLRAARERAAREQVHDRLHTAVATMEHLPARDACFDLIVAHGIWNLARSGAQFRRAVQEAARVAAPGAGVFVFTFSRHTLPPGAAPVPGEEWVFTEFAQQPQCFLTAGQLLAECAAAGFEPDPAVPLAELNRPRPASLLTPAGPVIYQGAFRKTARAARSIDGFDDHSTR
jgi:SAM-dependent methyltransferase